MLQHSALLSLKPKAQTAIASVKANAAQRRRLRRAPRHDDGGCGGFAPDPVFLSKKRMSSVDAKS